KSPTRSSSPSSTAWCLKPNSALRLAAIVAPVADASSLAPERRSAWRRVARTRTISAPSDFAASTYRCAPRSRSITSAAFAGPDTVALDDRYTGPSRMFGPEDKVRHHLDSLLALRGARLRGVLALDQEGRRTLRQSGGGTTDHGLTAPRSC